MYWFFTLFIACDSCTRTTDPDILDVDGDGFEARDDCDDQNPNAYPAAPELCDGVDNNCNEEIDEGEPIGSVTFYADVDEDGFGDPTSSVTQCTQPSGYIIDDNDCNDSDDLAYPGANEYCDGVDNDCDGVSDEDSALDSTIFYRDVDGDGFGNPFIYERSCNPEEGFVENDTDCNDSSVDIYPDAPEVCDDIDNDCDELVDDEDDNLLDPRSWYMDEDEDGFGVGTPLLACSIPVPGYVLDGNDCDDESVVINPASNELCGDELDNDCDGLVDDADDDAIAVIWYLDSDEDGFGDPNNPLGVSCASPSALSAPNDTDCDDADGGVNPDASETWYDGVDQDCNGGSDFDQDEDGFIAEDEGGLDCDDTEVLIHPQQPDLCDDGVDNNCDDVLDLCSIVSAVSWSDQQTLFGSSLAHADSKIAVGASGYDLQVQGAGAVFIYDDITQTPTTSIYSTEQASHLGFELGVSGDLDDNGSFEWTFGLYGMDANGVDSGAVYWVGLDQTGDVILEDTMIHLTGQSSGDQFGWSILSGQDFNSDGSADIMVGAPRSDIGGSDSGSVYLFHGPITETRSASSADLIIVGDDLGSFSGYSFDVTDINGDGLLDYIIGAPTHSDEGYGGGVYVLYGPQENFGFLSLAEGFWSSDWPNARLGTNIQARDDLTGDGLVDVATSAPERDNGSGAVYVLSGADVGANNVGSAWASFYGDRIDARLGAELITHDFNGDAQLDLLFSAPDSDISVDQGGIVYFVEGFIPQGTSIPQAQYYGTEDFAGMGSSILGTDQGVYISAPGVNMDAGDVYLFDWTE
jgi:hypothetical protein